MLRLYYGSDPTAAMPALLEGTRALDGLSAGSRVLIKPNLVVSSGNWLGADTRPETVEALIRVLQDRGVRRITVADGAGMGHSASKAFKTVGYERLARQYGVRLADVEKGQFVSRRPPLDGPFSSLPVSRYAAEADLLINVPVLKAHGETGITCALKNLKGLMTRRMKSAFHGADLHRAIAQLASAVERSLVVVDGGYGDLRSETGGTPVELGMMAVGDDPLEIDAFAAERLGFEPRDIGYISHYAAFRGLKAEALRPAVQALNGPAEAPRYNADTDQFARFPCSVDAGGVCCTCRGNLLFALQRLSGEAKLLRASHFIIGRGQGAASAAGDGPGGSRRTVAVGDCALKRVKADITVAGCPPASRNIVSAVHGEGGRGAPGAS
jgi:uncharacterized protein (DUF362 family)